MRWAWYVARMGARRIANMILVEKLDGDYYEDLDVAEKMIIIKWMLGK
jgi:hypothetical protein